MILFWVVVVLGIVWLVQSLSRSSSAQRYGETRESALEILQRRYASGEISKEEYLEMKDELRRK